MNWEKLIDALEEGVLILKNSEIFFANEFLVEREIIRDDWKGKRYYEVVKNLSLISLISRALSGQQLSSEEFQHGGSFYRIKVKWIDDLMLIFVSDVSSFKKYELSRREFVDNASHELKTPIAVIKGILETLLEEEDQESKKKFLEKALNRVNQMQSLVEDLLTLTSIESGREKLNLSEFNLKDLVDEAHESLEEEFKKSKVHFENLVDSSFEIKADRQKIYMLIRNLLDNAVKYNREGGKVWVSSQKRSDGWVIEVSDTGVGIPKEHLPFIFERFYRVDKEKFGTGLGLSIVKHIALLHRGEVKAYSQLGVGSRFVVFIPKNNPINRKMI